MCEIINSFPILYKDFIKAKGTYSVHTYKVPSYKVYALTKVP